MDCMVPVQKSKLMLGSVDVVAALGHQQSAAACREWSHCALLHAGAANAAPAAEVKQAYSIKAPNGVRDQTQKVKNAAQLPCWGWHALPHITPMHLLLEGTAQNHCCTVWHAVIQKSPCSACMHAALQQA